MYAELIGDGTLSWGNRRSRGRGHGFCCASVDAIVGAFSGKQQDVEQCKEGTARVY